MFAREASGARQRIRAAGFPAPKTLEDFDFAAQPGAERPLIQHLAQLAWIDEAANVCFLGPPGTGKTHLAIALAIKACQAGHRTLFATAQQWVDRLEASPAPQQPRRRTPPPGPLPAAGHRRDRLPPARAPGRQPALRAHRAPLRTRLDHRHQQPRLRGLGRDPRRRHGRRRPHRPPRPPRHHGHAQGQELPAARTRRRQLRQAAPASPTNRTLMTDGPARRLRRLATHPTGALFDSRKWLRIRFLLTPARDDERASGSAQAARTIPDWNHERAPQPTPIGCLLTEGEGRLRAPSSIGHPRGAGRWSAVSRSRERRVDHDRRQGARLAQRGYEAVERHDEHCSSNRSTRRARVTQTTGSTPHG